MYLRVGFIGDFDFIQRIAGSDSTMQQAFTTALGSTAPYTEMKVKEAITAVNNKRKERLMLLLDYIEDQGNFISTLSCTSLSHAAEPLPHEKVMLLSFYLKGNPSTDSNVKTNL